MDIELGGCFDGDTKGTIRQSCYAGGDPPARVVAAVKHRSRHGVTAILCFENETADVQEREWWTSPKVRIT